MRSGEQIVGLLQLNDRRPGRFTPERIRFFEGLANNLGLALKRRQAEEGQAAAKLSAEQAKAAAEQASKAKDHFLAVLSHELRTPLTPVLATVSMLQEDPRFDADTREQLEVIRRNVELEARLIDDLLDVTRIERGKVELDRRPVELCTIIRRAVEVCQPDIEARKLEFGVDVAGRPVPGRGRCRPPAAGLLEPAQERHQVHAHGRLRGHPLPPRWRRACGRRRSTTAARGSSRRCCRASSTPSSRATGRSPGSSAGWGWG